MLKVKAERLRNGWNQVTLAFYSGISVADISRIECGRLRPYPSQLEKLAGVLGIEAGALIEPVSDEPTQGQRHSSVEAFT